MREHHPHIKQVEATRTPKTRPGWTCIFSFYFATWARAWEIRHSPQLNTTFAEPWAVLSGPCRRVGIVGNNFQCYDHIKSHIEGHGDHSLPFRLAKSYVGQQMQILSLGFGPAGWANPA